MNKFIYGVLLDGYREILKRAQVQSNGAQQEMQIPLVGVATKVTEYLETSKDAAQGSMYLESIFNHLNGNQDQKIWPLAGISKTIPIPEIRGDQDIISAYKQIAVRYKECLLDYREGKASLKYIMDTLEEILFYVPALHGNDEISLYEHMKMVIAIGTCMAACHKENSAAKSRVLDDPLYFMFSMDFSGIQDFIYNISTKGALKSLRSRSFYLEIMMEHVVDELLEATQLTRANLIYAGGGHCYILIPNTVTAKNTVQKKMQEVNEWLLKWFQTELYIGYGIAECSIKKLHDEPSGSYTEIFRTMSQSIAESKMHRYTADQIQKLNASDISDGSRECSICKRVGKVNDDGHCRICEGLLRLSNTILRQEYYGVSTGASGNDLPLPGGYYLVAVQEDQPDKYHRTYVKNHTDAKWKRAKRIWIGDYAAKDTLEELADESEGIRRLGLYRADVDNLGNAFVMGFSKSGSGSNAANLFRTASLSKQLSVFFKYYINQIIDGKNAAIVYAGGDDLFVVGAWSDVIQFALDLQEKLTAYMQGTLTISGGIGLYPESYPISVMAQEVADLEDASKQLPEKNALTVLTEEYSYHWDDFKNYILGEKLKTIEDYFAVNKGRGNSLLYHLLELIREQDHQNEDSVNLVRYVYLLSRLEPEKPTKEEREAYQEFSKKMYRWMQNPVDRHQVILAIYLYVYKKREGITA